VLRIRYGRAPLDEFTIGSVPVQTISPSISAPLATAMRLAMMRPWRRALAPISSLSSTVRTPTTVPEITAFFALSSPSQRAPVEMATSRRRGHCLAPCH